MKQRIFCLFLFAFLFLTAACCAEVLSGEYTDVTSAMTQDSVVYAKADQDCTITLLQPHSQAVRLLTEMYNFVWHEGNPPVRFYDDETQEKLRALLPEVDIDSLHLTEFMAQEMTGEPDEDVFIEYLLDVDYQPGQLTAAVLGYQEENGGYRWFPYRADVKDLGLITFEIPKDEFTELCGKSLIFHVLTVRVGPRGGILINEEVYTERIPAPSKGAEDIIRIRRWYTEFGDPIDDNFSIFLVEKTPEMKEEINRIGNVLSGGASPLSYFPNARQEEARVMLEGTDADELLIYDIVALRAKDYKDTYGDVVTENLFASAYSPDCKMIAFLGFPIEDASEEPYFEWYVLRAEAVEEAVEIAFKQLIIPEMEKQAAMLVVLSQPIQ